MRRVLIAGCGYVGSATADLFHAAGWEVEGWTHSKKSAAELADKPYPIRAVDIGDRAALREAGGKFAAVIHCASSGGGGVESYREVYLRGAQNLIEELRPEHFVFTSSTSVYAQSNGEWVDEESAAKPTHATGQVLRETEEFVRQNRGTIARLAGIYGPGRSALLRKFLSGEARIEGDGQRILNQVHRDDIATALFLLAGEPNEQRTYNVTDDEPLTQVEAYTWLAAALQKPLPAVSTDHGPRKRGASNKRVSNRRIRALGWNPRYPTFRIGMEKSVLPHWHATG